MERSTSARVRVPAVVRCAASVSVRLAAAVSFAPTEMVEVSLAPVIVTVTS